ncbi:MAG: CoA transferase, partial [Acidimicrobiia bacterium]|nr:CoA transferase [Acidimicrobiia bacterium]
MTQGALAGIRVIDLTRVLAGPLCAMWLGDMGADVIKIERPGTGDDTRSWGPPFAGTESAYFLGVNRNKRSVAIDLQTEPGLDLVRRLIVDADIVVDNFKLGTLERWGLTEEWFEANAPAAVRCTIGGYGSTGPKAGRPGYDFILQAETGLMAITGEPDGESMKLGVAIVDICTGMLATISILGALQARARTGRGQRTEVSLHDTGIQMLANVAANTLVSGTDARRFGNGHPNIVPYRTYPAADGELAIAVGNDAQFARFAEILGRPGWADDERFTRNQDRVENRAVIDRLIAE